MKFLSRENHARHGLGPELSQASGDGWWPMWGGDGRWQPALLLLQGALSPPDLCSLCVSWGCRCSDTLFVGTAYLMGLLCLSWEMLCLKHSGLPAFKSPVSVLLLFFLPSAPWTSSFPSVFAVLTLLHPSVSPGPWHELPGGLLASIPAMPSPSGYSHPGLRT